MATDEQTSVLNYAPPSSAVGRGTQPHPAAEGGSGPSSYPVTHIKVETIPSARDQRSALRDAGPLSPLVDDSKVPITPFVLSGFVFVLQLLSVAIDNPSVGYFAQCLFAPSLVFLLIVATPLNVLTTHPDRVMARLTVVAYGLVWCSDVVPGALSDESRFSLVTFLLLGFLMCLAGALWGSVDRARPEALVLFLACATAAIVLFAATAGNYLVVVIAYGVILGAVGYLASGVNVVATTGVALLGVANLFIAVNVVGADGSPVWATILGTFIFSFGHLCVILGIAGHINRWPWVLRTPKISLSQSLVSGR